MTTSKHRLCFHFVTNFPVRLGLLLIWETHFCLYSSQMFLQYLYGEGCQQNTATTWCCHHSTSQLGWCCQASTFPLQIITIAKDSTIQDNYTKTQTMTQPLSPFPQEIESALLKWICLFQHSTKSINMNLNLTLSAKMNGTHCLSRMCFYTQTCLEKGNCRVKKNITVEWPWGTECWTRWGVLLQSDFFFFAVCSVAVYF